eukprot:scaffold11937_cov98-Isochrysis_galbana.AAC.2
MPRPSAQPCQRLCTHHHHPSILRRAVTATRAERAGADEVLPVRRKLGREFRLAQRLGNVREPLEKATPFTGSEAAGVERRRVPGHALVVDEQVVELALPAEERWPTPFDMDGEHLLRPGLGRGRGWRGRVPACRGSVLRA